MTGAQFKAWRLKNDLTQQQIADATRYRRETVARWQDRGTRPRVDVLLYAIFVDAVD